MKTIIEDIIKICKGLSFKKRLKIIKLLLINKNGLSVTNISTRLKMPLGTVARHILKLRKAMILKSVRKKQSMIYKINPEKLTLFNQVLKIISKTMF